MKKILDISKWQSSSAIDYKKLATDVDYVFLRAQYGSRKKDVEYDAHAKKLKANNIPFGAYAYALFISESDARVEARDFYKRATSNGANPTTFVVDVEEVTVKSGTTVNATIAFINELKKLTKKPVGLYTGHSFYSEHGMKKVTNSDFLWIPRYSGTANKGAKPSMSCDLWQYTDRGSVAGFKGGVDLSVVMTTKMENIIKPKKTTTTATTKTTTATAKTTAKKTKTVSYKVVSGDTLGKIAKKYNVTVSEIQKENSIANVNVIKVGQVLKITVPK